jgi:hypothetical protein
VARWFGDERNEAIGQVCFTGIPCWRLSVNLMLINVRAKCGKVQTQKG